VNGFCSVIELYRASGKPGISANCISYEGVGSKKLAAALAACAHLDERFGRFGDGPYLKGGNVEFSWSLGSNDSGGFYLSVDDFITRCESLHRGVVPDNFYLADLDFLCTAPVGPIDFSKGAPDRFANAPVEIQKIDALCRLVRLLGDLSLAGSLLAEAGRPSHLVFVKPASSGAAPVTVEVVTRINQQMLTRDAMDLTVLADLLSKGESGKVRTEEYRAVFRLAIASIGAEESGASNRFFWIVEQWDRILARFSYDVECLVDRLSFEGLRREIVDTELAFVGRVNMSIVDNATKFLGIPLSLVALTTVLSSESISSDVVVCLGALLVSLVVSGVAKAVGYQLSSTATAFEGVLRNLRTRATGAGQVAGTLNHLQKTFSDRLAFARTAVATFHLLAWLPPCVGVALIAWKYPPGWFGTVARAMAQILWILQGSPSTL